MEKTTLIIKSCPCCGNAAQLRSKAPDYFSEQDWTKTKHKIKCSVCPITTGWFLDKAKLIIGWNTRTDISESKLTEALAEIERLREALEYYADEKTHRKPMGAYGGIPKSIDGDRGQRARKALGKE